uniref:Troponin I, slow skeletal muscle-like n=1 Tax=Paramormyrops kingsleyae TaxID=1676925 RepID=A0A3B3SG71_9TELE
CSIVQNKHFSVKRNSFCLCTVHNALVVFLLLVCLLCYWVWKKTAKLLFYVGKIVLWRQDDFLYQYLQILFSLQKKYKTTASRSLSIKINLLKTATVLLAGQKEHRKVEREKALKERAPPLKLSGLTVQELQELCKELHRKTDVVDEERYDIAAKVSKNEAEIQNLLQKVFELKGKMKRPNLKRVRVSADAMLGTLLGSKHKESMDFKANFKTIKNEEEKKEELTDWCKNVDALSGMEGRKKLFDVAQ